MSSPLRFFVSLTPVFLLMYASAAGGAPASSLSPLAPNGTCPSSEAVWASIPALVPGGDLTSLPAAATFDVADLGDSYRVTVAKREDRRERIYLDAARDCAQRARFAAVFIVLTLLPPEALVAPPAKPSPVLASPAPPGAIVQPALRRIRLELGAFWNAAPSVLGAPSMASPGGELRLVLGGQRLRGVVGVGAQTRARFYVDGLDAYEERASLDVGLRAARVFGRFDLAGEVSVASAVFRARGTNTVAPEQQTRLDLGARAGLVFRLGAPRARMAPFVGAHAAFFPRQYDVFTTPQGVLGHTPALWLGATVGVCASL